MFWRFGGYANNSTIDNLLDKSDVTLEELLDESDLIQELKQHNTKLIEFLRDENTLRRLLKYVVAPGSPPQNDDDDDGHDHDNDGDEEKEKEEEEETDATEKGKAPAITTKTSPESEKSNEEQEKAEKSRLKYAYVACEVLSSETWSIVEALMVNPAYLQDFWDFLRRPPPLDPLQAGYFTKVNETLLEKKTEEMLELFTSSPGMVPAMLQHVDCPMVMDLLLKIISLEKAEGGQGIVDWLQAQDLIPMLLTYLSSGSPSSTQTSAGDFLKAIITISANASQIEQSCIGPNSLTRQLVSGPCMQSLVESMLHGGNPLTVGVGIVIEVIRKNNSDYDPENGHNPDVAPTNHDPIYLGTLLRMFAKHVPDFMNLILSSKHTVTDGDSIKIADRGQLTSAWGTQIEPLGFDRFKTCELMAELLHCSNMGLLNERGSEEFVRQRDTERDRMRAAGAFAPQKEEEDSAVDISEESTGYPNGSNSATGESPEELRVANSSEEDGFEKVAPPEGGDDLMSRDDSTASEEAFTEIQDRSKFELGEDFVDEPLSPKIRTMVEKIDEDDISSPAQTQNTSPLTPNTVNLEDQVRRVSLEDTAMTSPPEEKTGSDEEGPAVQDAQDRSLSPSALSHPNDLPTPLFSRVTDPDKTPTSHSPENTTNAIASVEDGADVSAIQPDDDSIVHVDDKASTTGLNIEIDLDGKPVVGDYLKIMFVENRVVPTILSFFFRFPWNNFLHNVVYDVVQQVFNGPMERGYNRAVAIDLFEIGVITQQIVDGQRRSDEAQQSKNMRLGYMGHLTLVAEEVVKFSERHPAELLSQAVMDKVLEKSWIDYVEQTLSETRERDNAILGGVRPDMSVGPRQAVLNAVNASQGFSNSSALANAGLNGGIGGQPGLDSIDLSNHGSASSPAFGPGSGTLLSGFGSSSDDDDEDMEESEDDNASRTAVALSTADTGATDNNTAVPLIPPPPAPLNVPPSRARRQLAARLALHKQQAEGGPGGGDDAAIRTSDDPFASLGDHDEDADGKDPFSLDEEEEDITVSGMRDRKSQSSSSPGQGFSTSHGLTSLFPPSSTGSDGAGGDEETERNRIFAHPDDESDQHSSSSENGERDRPVEAPPSRSRVPLEIDEDEDEDEEMGEMVAPSVEADDEDVVVETGSNSSSDDEEEEEEEEEEEGEDLSATEKEKLRGSFSGTRTGNLLRPTRSSRPVIQHDDEAEDETEDEEGDGLVEIAMPSNSGGKKMPAHHGQPGDDSDRQPASDDRT